MDELAEAITVDSMFESLSPLAIRTYNGKRVVFIVPSVPLQLDAVNASVIMEGCQTYEEQQRFVSDVILNHPAKDIIVVTRSPVVLSDAFSCQIYTWRDRPDAGGVRFRYVGSLATFGASPDRIALHVFGLNETIGGLCAMAYELTQRELTALRRKLTTAVNSKDNRKIVKVCDDAMQVFESKGYPDDWSRWQRAKEDATFNRIMGAFR